MLVMPKQFPTLKVASIGTAVFAVGVIGSFTLLSQFEPASPTGSSDAGVANTSSAPDKKSDTKKAVASAEHSTSTKASGNMPSEQTQWQPQQSRASQPVANYLSPATTTSPKPSSSSSQSSSLSPVYVSTPSLPMPGQPQPPSSSTPTSPSSGTSTDDSLLEQVAQPVTDMTDDVTGGLFRK